MTMGWVQPGTRRGTLSHDDRLTEDGAAEDVADGAVRRAPHFLQAELFDARSSGVMVAHFTPTPCSLMALAASMVIWSSVSSRASMPRS